LIIWTRVYSNIILRDFYYYYTNFNRDGQNGFTETGRPTASDLRSRLIVALTETVGQPPRGRRIRVTASVNTH
jgi:hypothetical protein